MNGRMYDAKLGRFLSPDNFVQDLYNTQSFNRYSYVWNNPLSLNDPSGEFIASAIIGAAISVVVNGISNLINGDAFFKGWLKSAIIGGISGAFSFGIGEVVESLSGVTKLAVQTFVHGHLGGITSTFFGGGSYESGFLLSALSSLMSAGAGKFFGKPTFWSKVGVIGTGGISGGVGYVIGGGKFWDGVRNGLIVSTLNHVAHFLLEKSMLRKMLENADWDIQNEIPRSDRTSAYVESMIGSVEELFHFYTVHAESPDISVYPDSLTESSYSPDGGAAHTVILTHYAFNRGDIGLLSSLWHEINHAFQWKSGWANDLLVQYNTTNGKTGIVNWILQRDSFKLQLDLGDTSPNTLEKFNRFNRWINEH
jgi:hypothetical protein